MLLTSSKFFDEKDVPIYCEYCSDISSVFIERAREKWGLLCEAIGGGYIDQVNHIILSFYKEDICTIEQARAIIVECNEEFVELINSHEPIRPYLSHYPYTKTGAKLSFSFVRPSETSKKAVDHAFICREVIDYAYYDFEEKKLMDMHEETYREAKKIVENQKNNDLFQLPKIVEIEKTQT